MTGSRRVIAARVMVCKMAGAMLENTIVICPDLGT